VSYGIIFWGNSSISRKIFTLQKRIIRIIVGAQHRTSCRKLFKKLEILTVPSQYIYSLMSFLKLEIRKNFGLTRQYIALIKEINTIFIDRLLTYLVFRKAHPTLGSEFLITCHRVLEALRMKGHSLK
jgi:GTP-sensing pleiotropic transcriptional regulator CodY